MKTLITEHWAGQVRGRGQNLGTRIAPVVRLVGPDVRTLFERAYPAFAERCRAVDEPGVALVAVDELTGNAMGMACLRARVDRHVTAIVGRHDRCDLYIEGNDRLALRQLVVVLDPVSSWRAGTAMVNFRILDLRTSDGMVDEEGRPLRGLRSEGPAMVRCGGYAIFALPLGDPTDWPAAAGDAWECIPERVYHDELVRVPDASVVRELGVPNPQITQVVIRTAGPRDTGMKLVSDRDLAGRLLMSGSWGHDAIEIGHQALREGVLIGRYARCDGAAGVSVDTSISRVHALLLLVDDRLLVIDVASTNGIREVEGRDARVIELIGHTELELGHATRFRWMWSS
jgi:hypothetical protein